MGPEQQGFIRGAPVDGSSLGPLRVQIDGNTISPLPVEIGASLNVVAEFASVISTVNTTDTPLAAGETFTGMWESCVDYGSILCVVLTDAPSITKGARIQFSHDGTEVITERAATVPANFPIYFSVEPEAAFFRIVYTNGATAQTVLHAQVRLGFQAQVPQGPLAAQTDDATLVAATQAHLKARHPSGAWFPLSTQDGTLDVRVANPTASPETGLAKDLTLQELRDRFPAVVALADATANGSMSRVGTFGHVWNGTTWDRVRSANAADSASGGAGVPASGTMAYHAPTTSWQRIPLADNTNSVQSRGLGTVAFMQDTNGLRTPFAAALVGDTSTGPNFAPTGNMLFNGTSWDRARGDIANGMDVDVTRVQGNVRTQRLKPFYASAAGGRVAFNITTGLLTIAATGLQNLGALVNPAGSGFDAYLDVGEFGSSANTTFQRIRNPTVTPTGTARSGTNTGGGSATSVLQMYVGGASPTFTFTGGTVSKTAHIAAFNQYLTEVEGAVVLRPGQAIVWQIQGPGGLGGTMTASIFFEYWELPAA